MLPRRLPLVLAVAIAALAPLSTRAKVAAVPSARPGDCTACHKAERVLPAGHPATAAMKLDDCAKCHAPKSGAALTGKLPSGHLHGLRGVTCAQCHGKGRAHAPATVEACLACHGTPEALVQRTAAVKPENPHASPHWGPRMECSVCHRQHEKTVNWCAHCHTFDFKVP